MRQDGHPTKSPDRLALRLALIPRLASMPRRASTLTLAIAGIGALILLTGCGDTPTEPEGQSIWGTYALDSVLGRRPGTWDGHPGWLVRADTTRCGAASEQYVSSHKVVDTLFVERAWGELRLDSAVYRGDERIDSTFTLRYPWRSVCYDRSDGHVINNDWGLAGWVLLGTFTIDAMGSMTLRLDSALTYAASQTRIVESRIKGDTIIVLLDDLNESQPDRECSPTQCVVDGYPLNRDLELRFKRAP